LVGTGIRGILAVESTINLSPGTDEGVVMKLEGKRDGRS
jgi:hypothetical protein